VNALSNAVWAVYPADSEPFELVRLDRETGERTVSVPLSRAIPNDAKRIAMGFGSAWVVSEHRVVHRVDLETARVVARIELSHHLGGIAIGAGAVWVSSDFSGGCLFRIDPRTNTATIVASPANPRELAAMDGDLWISHGSRVTRLDTTTMRPSATHDLGGFVLELRAGDDAVWAATLEETPIADAGETGLVFRLSADRAVPFARIDGRAAGLAFGLGAVWIAASKLQRINVADGATKAIDEQVGMPTIVGNALWASRISYTGGDDELVQIEPSGKVVVLARGELPAALASE
jgi:streptogramin lyase